MSETEGREGLQDAAARAVAVVGAAAWTQPLVSGSDLWWHLAAGREIVRLGAIPEVDTFSHTFAGQAWTNHEWLWDVLAWAIYRVEPEGVAWLSLALLLVVFLMLYRLCLRTSGSRVAAVAATWAVAATGHWFFEIRPHAITLLFTMILLATRARPWARWLWPPLVALWVNLHGGFLFGVGAIGLLVLVRTVAASLRARHLALQWRDLVGLALALVAVLANPYGLGIVAYPFGYLESESAYRSILEWLPPGFGADLTTFRGRFWGLALLTLPGLVLVARREPFLAALSAVTFAMAVTSLRFIPLFAVTAGPIAAVALGRGLDAVARRWSALGSPRASSVSLSLGALLCLLLWSDVRLYPRLLDRWTEGELYPHVALRYAAELSGDVRLFNDTIWGGYVMLHAPDLKVFYDGRADTLYDERLYMDYVTISDAAPGYDALLDRYGVNVALVFAASPLSRALRSGADWVPVFEDAVAALYVRAGSPLLADLPDPEPILEGSAARPLLRGRALMRRGDPEAAIAQLEAAVREDPLLVLAWAELVVAHARRNDFRAIAESVERGIAAYPRARARLRYAESAAWLSLGELGRAEIALRRAGLGGPSLYDRQVEAELLALRERRAQEDAP